MSTAPQAPEGYEVVEWMVVPGARAITLAGGAFMPVWTPGTWAVMIVRPLGHLYRKDYHVEAQHVDTGARTARGWCHSLGLVRKQAAILTAITAGWARPRPWTPGVVIKTAPLPP